MRWPLVGLLICLLAACSEIPSGHPPGPTPTRPEPVVREFYDWYLHARFPNPDNASKAKFEKYVTQRFFKEAMDEWDAVVFIAAQDADPTWANNFAVSPAIIKDDDANTEVTLNGKKVRATLRIFLKRENRAWKIDNVKRGTWKAAGS